MKKILSVILTVGILFSFSACSGAATPSDAVSGLMKALKAYDTAAIEEYADGKLIDDTNADSLQIEELRLTLKNLEFEILSTEENGNEATVRALIENVNMQAVMTDYLTETIDLVYEKMEASSIDQQDLQKRALKIFQDALEDHKKETATTSAEIRLTKQNGRWIVNWDDVLKDAVTGTLFSAMDKLGDFSDTSGE